jgi:hypothetical protein
MWSGRPLTAKSQQKAMTGTGCPSDQVGTVMRMKATVLLSLRMARWGRVCDQSDEPVCDQSATKAQHTTFPTRSGQRHRDSASVADIARLVISCSDWCQPDQALSSIVATAYSPQQPQHIHQPDALGSSSYGTSDAHTSGTAVSKAGMQLLQTTRMVWCMAIHVSAPAAHRL